MKKGLSKVKRDVLGRSNGLSHSKEMRNKKECVENSMEFDVRQEWLELRMQLYGYCGPARWCQRSWTL